MRFALIALVVVGCSPFGSGNGANGDGPPTQPPSNVPRTDGGTPGADTGSGTTPNPGGGTVPLLPCDVTVEERRLDFEGGGYSGWGLSQLGGVIKTDSTPIVEPSLATGTFGIFESTTEGAASADGATVILPSPVFEKPAWARVEWDAVVLQSDTYSAVGCTIGPTSQGMGARGRAYLATERDGAEDGLYPSLDSWWKPPGGQTVETSHPMPEYRAGTWQHFALEIEFLGEEVTVRAFLGAASAGELSQRPWNVDVNGITTTCGALYAQPIDKPVTIKVAMDNIVLSVCPSP